MVIVLGSSAATLHGVKTQEMFIIWTTTTMKYI